jgi:hypothetical protein
MSVRKTTSRWMGGIMAALIATPTKHITMNNYGAWKGGEGFGARKPRAPKHLRTGQYTTSQDRRARRISSPSAVQQPRIVSKHELQRQRRLAERAKARAAS